VFCCLFPTQIGCISLLFTLYHLFFFSFSLSLLLEMFICTYDMFICIYDNACICTGFVFHVYMWPLFFWAWLTLLKVIFSISIHLPANEKISFLFYVRVEFHCMQLLHFLNQFWGIWAVSIG
jgi:hypothetical protein